MSFRMVPLALVLVLAPVLANGCIAVSKDAYERDLQGMKQQQDWLEAQKKQLAGERDACSGKLKATHDQLQTCVREKQGLQDELAATKSALDQCTSSRGVGAKELANCQIERDKLQRERDRLAAENKRLLADYGQLKESLDKVQESIRKVRERLQKLVDGGKLRVKIANGFLVIEMQSDILFDVNKAEVKAGAKPVLAELAQALKELPDRRFQVAGHTDNTGSAAINWRLSTDRAVAVVEELVGQGLDPRNLSAGGYGPYLPVASNDTPDGRQRNRRVEFLLMPDLSELLNLAQ